MDLKHTQHSWDIESQSTMIHNGCNVWNQIIIHPEFLTIYFFFYMPRYAKFWLQRLQVPQETNLCNCLPAAAFLDESSKARAATHVAAAKANH